MDESRKFTLADLERIAIGTKWREPTPVVCTSSDNWEPAYTPGRATHWLCRVCVVNHPPDAPRTYYQFNSEAEFRQHFQEHLK